MKKEKTAEDLTKIFIDFGTGDKLFLTYLIGDNLIKTEEVPVDVKIKFLELQKEIEKEVMQSHQKNELDNLFKNLILSEGVDHRPNTVN